jgi:hypothetical protein
MPEEVAQECVGTTRALDAALESLVLVAHLRPPVIQLIPIRRTVRPGE